MPISTENLLAQMPPPKKLTSPEDYGTWVTRITVTAKLCGLLSVLEGKVSNLEKNDAEELEDKARYFIVQAISDEILALITRNGWSMEATADQTMGMIYDLTTQVPNSTASKSKTVQEKTIRAKDAQNKGPARPRYKIKHDPKSTPPKRVVNTTGGAVKLACGCVIKQGRALHSPDKCWISHPELAPHWSHSRTQHDEVDSNDGETAIGGAYSEREDDLLGIALESSSPALAQPLTPAQSASPWPARRTSSTESENGGANDKGWA